jgi:membrane protein
MPTVDTHAIARTLKKDGTQSVSVTIRAAKRFSADKCTTLAAGIAFYSAFSLAPMLLMVIAVAGWFYGAQAARGQLFARVQGFLGGDAASAIQAIVEHAHQQGGGGFAAILSIVLLIVGASATFSSLNTALDVVLPMPESGARSGVVQLVRTRLISFGLVLGVAFLLIVSLVLDTVITFIGAMLWQNTPFVFFGNLAQMLASFVIMLAGFGALIKFLPDASSLVRLRDAAWGGAVSAVLFTIGKKLFAMYLAHAGTASAFGAAGSLAVLLMWLYFSAAVLLLGAEVTAVRGGFDQHKAKAAATAKDSAAVAPSEVASPGTSRGIATPGTVARSRYPTLLKLAAQSAPWVLQGLTLLLPMRRRRGKPQAVQPLATPLPASVPPRADAAASRKGRLASAGVILASVLKPRPAPPKRGVTHVTGVKTPYGRAVASRTRHPVAAALFAAGTGLLIASLANREKK